MRSFCSMSRLAFALSGLLVLLAGCGGGGSGPTTPTSTPTPVPISTTNTITLQTVADPWVRATPRWRDIENVPYSSAFRAAFSYSNAFVRLSYARQPSNRTFQGHISARGLKPNFAYQLKLTGKPISGARGFGVQTSRVEASSRLPGSTPVERSVTGTQINGDDWANQQLGYAGRWWEDTANPATTNVNDDYFQGNYPANTLYGYLFLGVFITDKNGVAETDFALGRAYHITWQADQNGVFNELLGTFPITRLASAYDAPVSNGTQTLWYELETGRTQPVQLTSGTYHCRLLLTEEAFHTAGGTDGGIWQTVLATEDAGDQNPANDVVFSVS